jgi:hypothetical protein
MIPEAERKKTTEFIRTCIKKVNEETLIEECSYANIDLENFLSQLDSVRAEKKKVEIKPSELE